MKKTMKLLSLFLVFVMALSIFTACEFPEGIFGGSTPGGDITTDPSNPDNPDDPADDGKVTVYWCQGQKILREDKIDKGSTVTEWTPTVAGKEFKGWFANPGLTTPFDFSTVINEDTEIFASFKTIGGGDVDIEPEYADYYLIGTGMGSLSVSSWNHENSATNLGMTDLGNGQYKITIDFYAGDMFQICHGLSWDGQMGIGCINGAALVEGSETQAEVKDAEGNVVFTGTQEYSNPITAWNVTCAAGQDGKYEFVLDSITGVITWKLIERLDPKDVPVVENAIYFIGTFNNWDTLGLTDEWKLTPSEDGLTWTGTLTVTADMYADWTEAEMGFSCVALKLYNTGKSQWIGYNGDNNLGLTEGVWVITYYVETNTFVYNAEGEEPVIPEGPDYTNAEIIFVGSMEGNGWDTTNSTGEWALTVGEDGLTWTGVLTVEVETQVKLYDKSGVCGHDGGWIDPAAGSGENGNAVLSAGTYHFKYVAGEGNFTYWADGEDEPTTPDPEPTPDPEEPEVPTEGTVIYFQPTTGAENCWDAYCEGYAVYCWNDEGNVWVVMEEVDAELSLYSATIPAGYTNVIFVSLKSLSAGGNWNNKDSQTVDLVIPEDGSNLFTLVNSWDEAHEWKGTGEWSTK